MDSVFYLFISSRFFLPMLAGFSFWFAMSFLLFYSVLLEHLMTRPKIPGYLGTDRDSLGMERESRALTWRSETLGQGPAIESLAGTETDIIGEAGGFCWLGLWLVHPACLVWPSPFISSSSAHTTFTIRLRVCAVNWKLWGERFALKTKSNGQVLAQTNLPILLCVHGRYLNEGDLYGVFTSFA
ncbi:hypothetical protein N658DRAFT_35065 [Parathielavia hyrcaniae]|uniref:Uncharacterized protein n=1 Tax=Parathielavia hyrcaniae TaxID=113614 RepID=A0AAN6T6T9_9PEZI|nr:hypothetical protein N658DRAFT_35065 [Parathielavia hyrcaniae]